MRRSVQSSKHSKTSKKNQGDSMVEKFRASKDIHLSPTIASISDDMTTTKSITTRPQPVADAATIIDEMEQYQYEEVRNTALQQDIGGIENSRQIQVENTNSPGDPNSSPNSYANASLGVKIPTSSVDKWLLVPRSILRGHQHSIVHLRVTADNNQLWSSDANGVVVQWAVPEFVN
jgi:hypothetical protein